MKITDITNYVYNEEKSPVPCTSGTVVFLEYLKTNKSKCNINQDMFQNLTTEKLFKGSFIQYLRIVDFAGHIDRVIDEISEIEFVYFCVDTAPPLDVQHRNKVEGGRLYLLQQTTGLIKLIQVIESFCLSLTHIV